MNKPALRFCQPSHIDGLRLVKGINLRHHTFPKHVHVSYSIGMVLKGKRYLQIDDQEYEFSAGDCFAINPYQAHSCRVDNRQPHDYAVLSIQPETLLRLSGRSIRPGETLRFTRVRLCSPATAGDLSDWLQTEDLNDESWNRLAEIIASLLLSDGIITTIHNAKSGSPVVDITRRQIENHDTEALRLEELANTTHTSPFYLNRLFSQQIGIPPYSYLLQTRIKRSLELLSQSNSICEAAHNLGFSDQSHFTRLFKRQVGITPGRFLELNQKHPAGT